MSNQNQALDEFEAAKLATFVGSQLRDLDNRGEGFDVRSNRIDPNRFIKRVVQVANPNQPRNMYPQINNDESEIIERLNREAANMYPVDNYQQPYIEPTTAVPPLIPLPTTNPSVPLYNPNILPVPNNSPLNDIAIAVKSIDESLKALCEVFIVKAKKKKRKKVVKKITPNTIINSTPTISENSQNPPMINPQ